MSAVISLCGKYRYRLERSLANPQAMALDPSRTCIFVMLNPSTADGVENDPTIRRCLDFTQRFGCGKLLVVNLFAYRATNPDLLWEVPDPVGPANDYYLKTALLEENAVKIAAWGSNVRAAERAADVFKRFGPFKCLGMNKTGTPRHPLYVQKTRELEDFKG